MISVHFFIFILYIINIINAELLSHTIIKFEPFQSVNILSVQHFNNSNITFTDTKKIFIHNVKKARIKRNNQRQILDAKNLLNQRIHGNSVPQCPCVIKPGTDKCIAYDSRYQAATIEEALVAFQDLTMDDDDDFKYSSTIINAKTFTCQTLECQTCAAILLKRIKQIGMVPSDLQVSIPLPKFIDSRYCRRLRFLKPFSIPNPPQPSYHMKALIERGLQYAGGILRRQQITYPARNRFWLSTQSPSPLLPPRPLPLPPPPPPPIFHPPPPPPPHIQPQQFQFPFFQSQHLSQYPMQQSWFPSIFNTVHSNGKGAGAAIYQSNGEISKNSGGSGTGGSSQHSKKKVKRKAEPPVLGIRYTISCVRHGEIDDDNMLTLCGTCWTWRKLPPDYFPPLINELVCSKENQGHCLSGWGKCQQKYRNFDVLRNVNGNWQPTTISTATCCDCRIRAGTEIHPLVIGKRQN